MQRLWCPLALQYEDFDIDATKHCERIGSTWISPASRGVIWCGRLLFSSGEQCTSCSDRPRMVQGMKEKWFVPTKLAANLSASLSESGSVQPLEVTARKLAE